MFIRECNLVQGTQEWLDFRRKGIGASDAAVIMGVSPWCTPDKLLDLKAGRVQEQADNPWMRRGREMEPLARFDFEMQTGISVRPAVVENTKIDGIFASLDGVSEDFKTLVEIKCPGEKDHALALENRIPDKYYPQLQHQMLVLNLVSMYYFSFDGKKGHLIEVNANESYQQQMLEKELAFYQRMITDTRHTDLNDAYEINTSTDWLLISNEWLDVRDQIKALERKEQDCKNALIHLANQRSTQGGRIRLQKILRKGTVDYSAIPELNGIDLERYRKPSSETFRIDEVS